MDVMTDIKTIYKNGSVRLKDTPRPEDLDATTSPVARLVDWLRA
ncbi:hypothetical protein DM2_3148 [Halorubrum sp. DM2]|nr:hypothetical protein DM2_3148 [Halorubrum sp. DM2]